MKVVRRSMLKHSLRFCGILATLCLLSLDLLPPLFRAMQHQPTSEWACRDHDCSCTEARCKTACCCFPDASDGDEDHTIISLEEICNGPQEELPMLTTTRAVLAQFAGAGPPKLLNHDPGWPVSPPDPSSFCPDPPDTIPIIDSFSLNS